MFLKIKIARVVVVLCATLLFFHCNNPVEKISSAQKKNLIVVVIDGPRYSETWGDTLHDRMPFQKEVLKQKGVFFTQFFNNGFTRTMQGHDEITTGMNEDIDNTGLQNPAHPSFLQLYRKQSGDASTDAWVIASKDKLAVLADCSDVDWHGQFNPSTDCGVNGLASGYRDDTITLRHALGILKEFHPHVLVIQFKEPDVCGHQNDWNGYLKNIHATDEYVQEIFQFIQNDDHYKNNTDLIITNDHGRHPDGWLDGFISHGDTCYGCRHISLLCVGPDFEINKTVEAPYTLVDLNATINSILSLDDTYSQGHIIDEALK